MAYLIMLVIQRWERWWLEFRVLRYFRRQALQQRPAFAWLSDQ